MNSLLLLPESTTELRLKNYSSWVKSVGIRQVEKENIYGGYCKPSFMMGYDAVRPDIGEMVSITSIYGMCMYDVHGKLIEPKTLYLRRPVTDHHKELLEMSKYYGCEIKEENTENMEKFRQRMKDAREKLKQKDHPDIAFQPISAELNQKLLDYFQAYDSAWKYILNRNGF